MKVLVGSRNPVKVEAVREAFAKYFDPLEVIGLEVDPHLYNSRNSLQRFRFSGNFRETYNR